MCACTHARPLRTPPTLSVGRLKREARRYRIDPSAELAAVVQRLPPHYRSVGVRGYNPVKAPWKLQLVWGVMVCLCAFLALLFFSTLASYWSHVEERGVGRFVYAYLVTTLVVQARALSTPSPDRHPWSPPSHNTHTSSPPAPLPLPLYV